MLSVSLSIAFFIHMLSSVKLNVVMLNVIMLSVLAPLEADPTLTKASFRFIVALLIYLEGYS
jgi:hypothetical protein